MKVLDLREEELYAEVATIYGKNESSIHEITYFINSTLFSYVCIGFGTVHGFRYLSGILGHMKGNLPKQDLYL